MMRLLYDIVFEIPSKLLELESFDLPIVNDCIKALLLLKFKCFEVNTYILIAGFQLLGKMF